MITLSGITLSSSIVIRNLSSIGVSHFINLFITVRKKSALPLFAQLLARESINYSYGEIKKTIFSFY